MQQFFSHGYHYGIDPFGVVTQLDPEPFVYDPQYSQVYDKPEYTRGSDLLQAMRVTYAAGAHGRPIRSILDVGFGNGAFMKFASLTIEKVYGFDITGITEIENCKVVNDFVPADVYTFHDVLEHYHDLGFLRTLPCSTLVVSLPYCHYHSQGQEWFDTQYKHRKPNEHVRHFDEDSLISTLDHYGYSCVAVSAHEDLVRKSTHGLQNILSAAFKKRKARPVSQGDFY